MNPCCKKRIASKRPNGALRRGVSASAWLLPGSLLVLMPKCPVCFAAYIALFTGVGISIPAASGLRLFLMVACGVSLVLLALFYCRKFLASRSNRKPLSP